MFAVLLANRITHKKTKPQGPSHQRRQANLQNSTKFSMWLFFFPLSKYLPKQKIPAGTAWESTFKTETLLVNNVTRSMRPKNMASSDLKIIIAKAENQTNCLCFCCIQYVNASSTVKIKQNCLNYLFPTR